jgi:hypothetical protein
MQVPRIGIRLVCVLGCGLLGGCSVSELASLIPSSQQAPLALPVPDPSSTPDQQQFVPGVVNLANTLKLTGTPEMSRLRRAPPIAPTDWMFCLRSRANERPGPYAVFVKPPTQIVHVRAAVKIDDCDLDRFEPLGSFAAPRGDGAFKPAQR